MFQCLKVFGFIFEKWFFLKWGHQDWCNYLCPSWISFSNYVPSWMGSWTCSFLPFSKKKRIGCIHFYINHIHFNFGVTLIRLTVLKTLLYFTLLFTPQHQPFFSNQQISLIDLLWISPTPWTIIWFCNQPPPHSNSYCRQSIMMKNQKY